MMTLFNRFYFSGLIVLAAMMILLLLKPMLIVFMLMGFFVSYAIHYLIKNPSRGYLLVNILAECLGLMLMLALFVSLLVVFKQLVGH